jgi:hypothetical protein
MDTEQSAGGGVMDRRKFLKYAGGAFALAGAAASGYYLARSERPPAPTPSSTMGRTEAPTSRFPPLEVRYRPDESAPLEDLVILKGQFFKPEADVSGGVPPINAEWYITSRKIPDATGLKPHPIDLSPGSYNPLVLVTDSIGQRVSGNLPRVIRLGDPRLLAWRFGVTARFDIGHPESLYTNIQEVDKACGIIRDTGIEAVRINFSWGLMEPSEGTFDWSLYDAVVSTVRRFNLDILALVAWCPPWATSLSQDPRFWEAPPEDPVKYGNFVFQLVDRYKNQIKAWQIWNEPNLDTYFRGVDAHRYTDILKQGYLGAKYADPECMVVTAGLANDTSEWLAGRTSGSELLWRNRQSYTARSPQ